MVVGVVLRWWWGAGGVVSREAAQRESSGRLQRQTDSLELYTSLPIRLWWEAGGEEGEMEREAV